MSSRFIIENIFLYIKQRCVLLVVVMLFINGFDKRSLELIRLAVHARLVKRYQRKLRKFLKKESLVIQDDFRGLSEECSVPNIVWVCWFQGVDEAPAIVQKCVESVKDLEGYEVRILDSTNLLQYTDLPRFIIEKWKSGIIRDAHFSDLLRIDLLYKFGGVWVDSTVLLTSDKLPTYVTESQLFLFQSLKPGRDGKAIYLSSWLMSTVKGHPVFFLARQFLIKYWSTNKRLDDYFLLHIVLVSIFNEYPKFLTSIPKQCNSGPHLLQLELNDPYSPLRESQIKAVTDIHKLTYKLPRNITNDSFRARIIDGVF